VILDDQYRRNGRGAGKVELRHGAYHYLHPNAGGAEQASYFLKHADLKSGQLVPVLDIEESSGMSVAEVQQEVLDWLEGVSTSCNCEPIIYCNRHYFETYFQEDERFNNQYFWIALYERRQLEEAEGDERIILWQFSDQGQINGIPERVDLNVLRDGLDLDSLLIP
jgi:lysozyme